MEVARRPLFAAVLASLMLTSADARAQKRSESARRANRRSARAQGARRGSRPAQRTAPGTTRAAYEEDLDRESFAGVAAVIEDLGQNLCGCPDPTTKCLAVSANLEPPTALPSP